MVKCAALYCNTRSRKGVAMFSFPTDPVKRKLWVRKVRRKNFKFNPNKNSKLCEKHFLDSDFRVNRKLARSIGYTMRVLHLKDEAIPSVFDNIVDNTNKMSCRSTSALEKRQRFQTLQALTLKQPKNMCVRDSTDRCSLQSKHKCCFPKSKEEKESDKSIKKAEQPSFSDCMYLKTPIKTEPCDDYNEYEQDQCCGDAPEQYRHFTTDSESLESQKNLVPSKYSSASSEKIENEKCLRKSSKLSKNTSDLDENVPFEKCKEEFKLIKIRETKLKLDPSHFAEKPSDLARIANQSQTGECMPETSGSIEMKFQNANSHISGSSALMKENSGICSGKFKNVQLIFKMTNSEYVKILDRSSETETKSTNEFETNDKPAEEVKTLQTDESVTVEIGVKQLPKKAWASASNKPIMIAWQKSSEDIGKCPTLNGQTDTAECDKISSSESELPETDKTQIDLRVSGKTIETPEEERLKPSPCETDHVKECSSSNLMGMKRNSTCMSNSTNLGTSSEETTKKKFISSEMDSGTTEVIVFPQPTQKVTVYIPRDGDCYTNKVRNGKLLKLKNAGGPSGKTLNHKSLRPCPCELHKTEMSVVSSESKYSSTNISDIFISKVLSCVSLNKEVNRSFSFLDTDSRKNFNIYVFNNNIGDTIYSDVSGSSNELDDSNQMESTSSDTKSLIYENNLDDLFLSLMCKSCPCPADPDHVRAEKLSDTMLYVSVSCCCDHLICSWIWHMK